MRVRVLYELKLASYIRTLGNIEEDTALISELNLIGYNDTYVTWYTMIHTKSEIGILESLRLSDLVCMQVFF